MTLADVLKTAVGALVGVGLLYALEPTLAQTVRGGTILGPAVVAGVSAITVGTTGYVGLGLMTAALIAAADNYAVERWNIDLV